MQVVQIDSPTSIKLVEAEERKAVIRLVMCPSCGHSFEVQHEMGINSLPMGMKFDPNDQEILEHLEAKSTAEGNRLHPLIDDFIPTLEDENGICYTHPEKLPGMSKDGHICHFFHRPSKAYTTGTRKRRKVQKDKNGNETRWHKTGKTRPLLIGRMIKGYKKILVLYTNYGRQKKPEKTNWVMHQYHLGSDEEEKEGEFVLSKVFYQTQPRQCGATIKDSLECITSLKSGASPITMDYYNFQEVSNGSSPDITKRLQFGLIPNMTKLRDDDDRCTYIRFSSNSSKGKLGSN